MDERTRLVEFWMGDAPSRPHDERKRNRVDAHHAFDAISIDTTTWKETGQYVVSLVVARHADLADVEAQARMWLARMWPLTELNGLRFDLPAPVLDITEHTLAENERYMLVVYGEADLRLIGARGHAMELRRFHSWPEALGYIQRNHWHDYATEGEGA